MRGADPHRDRDAAEEGRATDQRFRRVFRSRLAVCGFITMAAIVAGFTAGMVVLAASDGGWLRLVYPVLMAPLLWVAGRWLRLRVEVDGDGLRIVNSKPPEILVPWSHVCRFDLGATILFGSRIVCVTRDGQRIGLDVFTGAWWVRWESWSRWTPTRKRLAELNTMLTNRAAPSSAE